MKAFGIILWIMVPTAIYFWRAGLIGNNPHREGQPLLRWMNAGNIPFFLLTAVKVYLFWLVAVYMLIKAFSDRITSSPWTAMATVDGKYAYQVQRTRGWAADFAQVSSSDESTSAVATYSPASRPPEAAGPTQSASTVVPEPAPALGRTAVEPDPPASVPVANTSSSDATAYGTPAAALAPVAGSEEEMTKEMAYSLAALCEQISRLYDECIEKADNSERARAMAETDYVNGVQQHPISKKHFANMAERLEGELTLLLQQLHDLSARGRSMWSDFMFLAGGPKSDFQTALTWCAEHGIDGNTVSTIVVKGLFLKCDFGLSLASFLQENQRLGDHLSQSAPDVDHT